MEFFLVSVFLVAFVAAGAEFTVIVDPTTGNDTNCFSLQELLSTASASGSGLSTASDSGSGLSPVIPPCRTLNRALGDEQQNCGSLSCSQGSLTGFDGAVIRLASGEHRLTSELLCFDMTSSAITNKCQENSLIKGKNGI